MSYEASQSAIHMRMIWKYVLICIVKENRYGKPKQWQHSLTKE